MRYAVLFAFVVLSTAGLAPAAQDKKKDEAKDRRDAVFAEVNRVRKGAKDRQTGKTYDLPPLQRNAVLDAVAQEHADSMARKNKVGNDFKILTDDGKAVQERARAAKYAGNVADVDGLYNADFSSDGNIVTAWARSFAWQEIVLDAKYTETGVGAARAPGLRKGGAPNWYYVQVFGVPKK